jgi:hypothetical protein
MPKMGESHLLNIRQGGVSYVNLLHINMVIERSLSACPQFLVAFFWHWQKWGECGMMVVGCGV